jgi:hypothetical protein
MEERKERNNGKREKKRHIFDRISNKKKKIRAKRERETEREREREKERERRV